MKLSIIIPLFNNEKFIGACLKAILRQTDERTEVILVDDGSTDGSAKICRSYAEKNPQIRYVRKQKGGVSSARNTGLDMASGEYLLFCDSDDYYLEGALDKILSKISESKPDLLVFGFTRQDNPCGIKNQIYPAGLYKNSGYSYLENLIAEGYSPLSSSCRYAFRRDIIIAGSARFDESLVCNEDYDFNLEYLVGCRNIIVIDEPLYFYRNTPGSLSKRNDAESHLSILKMSEKWHRKLCKNGRYPKLEALFARRFCIQLNLLGLFPASVRHDAVKAAVRNPAIFMGVDGLKIKAVVAVWRILGFGQGIAVTSRVYALQRMIRGNRVTLAIRGGRK